MNTHVVGLASSQEPRERFNALKTITGFLAAAGHTRPSAWEEFVKGREHFATLNIDHQRYAVNVALREIFSQLDLRAVDPINTLDERYCIVDEGALDQWLLLLEKHLIPFMVRHDLPLI